MNYSIRNVRFGTGQRTDVLYAQVFKGDEMIISATYEYCVQTLEEILRDIQENPLHKSVY